MAKSPRTPTFRTKYENFHPKSEMKENEEAYLLHIDLPGFIKETIKINFEAPPRILRIVGEQPIDGGRRWSRFDQSYPVPENCEVEKLYGKFEQGTLIVTMPKKFTSPATPKAQVETTKEKGPSSSKKDEIEPKPKIAKETIPSKSPTDRVEEPIGDKKSASSPRIVKSSNDLKELKGTQKDTSSPSQRPKDINHRLADDKGLRALNPVEPFVEPRPQNVLEEKRQDEIRQKTILEAIRRQLQEKDEKQSVTKKEVKEEEGKPYESRKPEKYVHQNMVLKGKEIKARKESPKVAESSAPKASEIDKAKSNKEDEIYTIGKGIKELAASASEVVTRIREGKSNDQDKPLVANMGAAVLVIVALGAYVTYKFNSSDRT